MKRLLSLLITMVVLSGLSWAQNARPVSDEVMTTFAQQRIDQVRNPLETTRTVACGPDTLIYGSYKNVSGSISGVGFRKDTNIISHAAQWFPAPNDVTVSGLDMIASIGTETGYTIDILVDLWMAGPDSLPMGSPLASTTVTVDSAIFPRLSVNFPSAVTVPAGNGYVVSIGTDDPDSSAVFWSNQIQTPTQGEGLGESNAILGVFNDAQAFWLKAIELTVGGDLYDVDFLIEPYVTYSMNANFDAPTDPTDCTPQNTEVQFTNTTSPIAKSRYYNGVKTFKTFRNPSIIDETFTWRFTATDSLISTDDVVSYTFTNVALAYDVELEVGMLGLSSTGCLDDTTQSLPSGVGAAADFDTDAGTSLTVNFTDVSVASDSVVYDFGDGSISNEENPTHTYSDFGTYSVTQIAYNNCGNDTLTVSITITCNAATADFSFTQTDGLTVAFTDNSQNADSVVITFGDDEEATLTGPTISHTYATEGTYEVCLTAFNECGPTELCQDVTVILSGLAHLYTGTLSVFPNPSEGSFTVEVFEQGELSMRVFNLMGQEILHQSARGRAVLDLSGEQSGVYLLQGTVDGQRFTKRLIVK